MSLKKNIAANYISQLYVAGIGILILPLYIKYMGAEAYGLVGFFTMLQACFALLDLGLTPTIGRETARYRGGTMSALQYRQLFRALSLIFFCIALIGGTVLFFMAEPIADQWLNIKQLSRQQVVLAVQIMAVSVALRWMSGLYRGVVTGSEKLVWISGFNVLIATLRFIAVFASMKIYGFTPFVFFWHQLAVAVLEVAGLWWMGNTLLPTKRSLGQSIGWSFSPIKPVLKFALTIAFTSSVWVMVTQTDKLILSGILPLDEYGFFTLAVMVAAGIMILSQPVSTVIMPRMARLHAEGKHEEMIQTYRNSTQLVSVVAGSASIVIAFFAEQLLYAWTGDWSIAGNAAPILRLYVLGYGVLAIAAFPYYLQYALGNLKYHLIGNLVIVITLIPAIVWAATNYGAEGAGWAWLGINSLYLVVWVGYVHHRLEPGLHLKWLVSDSLKIYIPVTLGMLLVWNYAPLMNNRIVVMVFLIALGFLALLIAGLSSDAARNMIKVKLKST
ncbi:MAG: polysaccharide biosynthesis protein [Thalassobium sp.]|nr:MAG: polysaccharide biosynthesis protein [Thalassobium sp.]